MSRYNSIIFFVLGIFLVFGVSGCSEKKGSDLYTIGISQYTSNPLLDSTREGFIQALEDTGFKHGEKIKLDFRDAQGDMGTIQLIIQNFLQNEVDMICAISTPSLQAAINGTEEVPIIFGAVANPYRAGAGQDSLNHQANVTGASAPSPIRKGLEMILAILPEAKRVGTLWNPAEENSHYDMDRARKISEDLGLELVEIPVSSSSEVYLGAQILAEKKIDAFMQILDNVVCASFDSLVKAADNYRVPLFTLDTQYAGMGACVTLGWDYFDNGYKSGVLALRVINGEKPADIPFQSLDKAKFYINRSACEKQDLIIPDHILELADKVID